MAALGVLVLFGLLFLYEYSRVRRFDGGAREMAAFLGTMVIACAFAFALALGVDLPAPTQWIDAVFERVQSLFHGG